MTASLFAVCVIPGCTTPVTEHGQTCPACLRDFGAMLRPTGQPPLTADDTQAAHGVRAAYAAQRQLR